MTQIKSRMEQGPKPPQGAGAGLSPADQLAVLFRSVLDEPCSQCFTVVESSHQLLCAAKTA